MSQNFLFAIDPDKHEVIVSESPKGSKQINFIERIARHQNEPLFAAVSLLTTLSRAADFDLPLFKAMDKVCQLMYAKTRKTAC